MKYTDILLALNSTPLYWTMHALVNLSFWLRH